MSTPLPLYKITSEGQLLDGFELADVRQNLQNLFGIREETVDNLFSSPRSVIRSGLEHDQAIRYHQRLTEAGVKVNIVELPAGDDTVVVAEPPQGSAAASATRKDELRHTPLEFTGNGKEYFGIWIVNILLTIVTLGIYSAWATVRNKQYFYGNTHLDNASFQYLASPIAILKGRLIAAAVFIVYTIISQIYPLIGWGLFLAIMLMVPWIVIRSLRFNALNSAYRNVRFNFEGTLGEAFMVFIGWPLLTILTLGLLTPYVVMKGDQFRANGSRYGLTPFHLNNTPRQYYVCFGIGLLMAIGLGLAAFLIGVITHPLVGAALGMVVYFVLFGYFMTTLKNLYMNGVSLDGHRFESNLEVRQMLWLYFSNSVLVLVTLGLFIPFAKVRMASYRASCTAMLVQGDLDGFVNAESKQASALGQELGEAFDIGFSPV